MQSTWSRKEMCHRKDPVISKDISVYVSLYSSACPGTRTVDQVRLEFRDLSAGSKGVWHHLQQKQLKKRKQGKCGRQWRTPLIPSLRRQRQADF